MQIELEIVPFKACQFEQQVRTAARLARSSTLPDQVKYLISYLTHDEMGAASMLVERPYVDRHYLTEYQGYYATGLRDVPRHTTRVHLFSGEVDLDEARERLRQAGDEETRRAVQSDLQEAYLGFVVLRPLPTAPIGRTVLKWYGGRDARCFGPQPPPHRVHVLGLTLKAHGVQFHQQDQAVGACATAAVWCALAAVMRRDGGRSPTPITITEQAIRSLPTSRALPAVAGLTLEQMVGAINASGYSPDVIKPEGNPATFQLQLMTYVRSGIPVILQVREEGAHEGHAVTVVGFRVSDDEHAVPLIEDPFSESRSIRAKGMTRLYVNDDRLGPYARMVWEVEPSRDPALATPAKAGEPDCEVVPESEIEEAPHLIFPTIKFSPHTAGFEDYCTPMRIWAAIAPLYPKIRINALELLSVAAELWPLAAFIAGKDRDQMLLESFFSLGGSYTGKVYKLGMEPARAADIASSLLLSRYVGVLRFTIGAHWLIDVVCDATDIHRKIPAWSSVLAILFFDPDHAARARTQIERDYPHVVIL